MDNQKRAFTLVELIVVITILAILGTIAFISLQGYSRDARDSVRTSDMSRIKTSLELFQLDAGKYPETTNKFEVTYKGGTTWNQGIFGNSTFNNVEKLDKIPKDPSTDREYIYSVTNTKQEYEIAGIMEGDTTAFNPLLMNESLAGDKLATAKVSGNYNGKILKVSTGGLVHVLAIPSLITSSESTLEDIVTNNNFVYNGYKNLPFQYDGGTYNVDGEEGLLVLVQPDGYELHSGSTLESLSGEDASDRITLLQNMKAAYLGTSITEDSTIQEILSITDFTDTNSVVVNLAGTVVNNTLGASISTNSITTDVIVEEEVLDSLVTTGDNGNIAMTGYNGLNSSSYSSSSNYEVLDPYFSDTPEGAFDGYDNNILINNDSLGQAGRGIWIAGSVANEWIQVDFGKQINFSGFKIINKEGYLTRSAKDVLVMISDNMVDWINLPYTLPSQNTTTINFDEVVKGRYFRLYVTNNYSGPYIQIEEIEIYQETSESNEIVINNTSCKTILESEPTSTDGIYTIDPENNGIGFEVYCDMTTDGGGWTLFVNHKDVITPIEISVVNTSNYGVMTSDNWQSVRSNYSDMLFIDENSKISKISKAKLETWSCLKPSDTNSLLNLAVSGWRDENEGCENGGLDYSLIHIKNNSVAGASLYQTSDIKFDIWPYVQDYSYEVQNELMYFLR